ncbi:unnamed protein product [Trichobilharzia regenti]|nr:unnamed protein product [Trichobilharzia regenti]
MRLRPQTSTATTTTTTGATTTTTTTCATVIRQVYTCVCFSNRVDKWKHVHDCLTNNAHLLSEQISKLTVRSIPTTDDGHNDISRELESSPMVANNIGYPVSLVDPIRIPHAFDCRSSFGIEINSEIHHKNVVMIPHIDPLPGFTMWSKVQQNFSVEDERERVD